MPNRVRLIDVAERAGVSMKTVSNVVHGYAHVRPQLREKVQAAIDELGYRPNLAARRLVTGRTGMIALAMPEIDHPYFSEIADQIDAVASSRGYRVIIEQTRNDPKAERAVLADREAGLVDGVIFQPTQMATLELARSTPDVPVVLLGEVEAPLSLDHVMIDNVAAAAAGVARLHALGRERIAFLGLVENDQTATNRLRLLGYQQGLIEAGLPSEPALVLTTPDFAVDSVEAAVTAAWQAGRRFDAVLCRDDRFGFAAMSALRRLGVAVPDEVAVLGWDDSALCAFTTPQLSSIAPDKRALAERAFGLLLERLDGYHGVGRHEIVPFTLSSRESAPGG